jgi:hypothetical protein
LRAEPNRCRDLIRRAKSPEVAARSAGLPVRRTMQVRIIEGTADPIDQPVVELRRLVQPAIGANHRQPQDWAHQYEYPSENVADPEEVVQCVEMSGAPACPDRPRGCGGALNSAAVVAFATLLLTGCVQPLPAPAASPAAATAPHTAQAVTPPAPLRGTRASGCQCRARAPLGRLVGARTAHEDGGMPQPGRLA